MAGDHTGSVTIALQASSDYAVADVIGAIQREHPAIAITFTDGSVHLSSPVHLNDFLTALWWSTAANQALFARASDLRPRLIEYLLT